MKLIYKHNQEHHFKIIRYPDGQQNVELDLNYFNNPKEPVTMQVSIRNWMEFEIFHCLYAALIANDFFVERIDYLYLMGMRSDRSFAPGQPNYFRDVFTPHMNGGRHDTRVLYPHSKVGLLALRHATKLQVLGEDEHRFFVIRADASALWSEFGHHKESPHFAKVRTPNGVEMRLPKAYKDALDSQPEDMPILIKDDLCDGGATFIAIAEYLQMHYPNRKRFLFVAHGLFTKGVDHVADHYEKIITTNSYQEFEPHPKLKVIDVWDQRESQGLFGHTQIKQS